MKAIADIRNIRKKIYNNHEQRHPYMFKEWKWYSYRKFKAKLYMETASLFAYLFLKISTPPNVITLIYVLMGIFGGILLALPSKVSIILAIVFFYFRGIFDWTDGAVARLRKRVSISGGVLDSYGAFAGWISLWTGIGFYLGNNTHSTFYYLTPLIPALFAADLHLNARETFIYHYLSKKEYRDIKNSRINILYKNDYSSNKGDSKIRKLKCFIDKIFEHNARTVDLICLVIFIEIIFSVSILWIYYSAFLFWQINLFIVRLFLFSQGEFPEKEFKKLKELLYR